MTWAEQAIRSRQSKLAILIFTLEGLRQKEIGALLKVSPKTIDWHVLNLRKEHKTFGLPKIAVKVLYGINS